MNLARRASRLAPQITARWYHSRWYHYYCAVTLGVHLARGGKFLEWYRKYVDTFARLGDAEWLERTERKMGPQQVEYLKSHGLRPENKVLDFGCGNLRGGIHIIRYLDKGNYVGVDISTERLNCGRERIRARGLEDKAAMLLCITDMAMTELTGWQFDVIWSMSVLSHMPVIDIEGLFQRTRYLLKRGGVFFATYTDGGANDYRMTVKDWAYADGTLVELGGRCGLRCEVMNDWRHPIPGNELDRMLRITIV